MNSGNLGTVTVGAGTVFGAHAADTTVNATIASRRTLRIEKSLLLFGVSEPTQQPARHVRDDRHAAVAGFVQQNPGVTVDAGDALAV